MRRTTWRVKSWLLERVSTLTTLDLDVPTNQRTLLLAHSEPEIHKHETSRQRSDNPEGEELLAAPAHDTHQLFFFLEMTLQGSRKFKAFSQKSKIQRLASVSEHVVRHQRHFLSHVNVPCASSDESDETASWSTFFMASGSKTQLKNSLHCVLEFLRNCDRHQKTLWRVNGTFPW